MATDPLRLDRLPPLDPPEDLWQAISGRLDATPDAMPDTTPGRRRRGPLAALAAAAAVAAMAVTVFVVLQQPGAEPAAGDPRVERLMALSAALEARLDDVSDSVLTARTADALARIEQELAWLDVQIAASPGDPSLWAERVALLDDMHRRYRRADWQSQLQVASY